MEPGTLIKAARNQAKGIFTDKIRVMRLDTPISRGYEVTERRFKIYEGPALVQIAANTRAPIQEQDTGAVSRAVVKLDLESPKLVVNDDVEVVESLDERMVGRHVILGDTLQQGWSIVARYYGNFTDQRARV